MERLDDLERRIGSLTREDKARLLGLLAKDLGEGFPAIDCRPNVCGGDPCIVRTRIPVWALEQARRQGLSEKDLLKAYPSLRSEDLAQAWAFVRVHPEDIGKQIRENESA
jgi:uncharacterized protein (DUF433 family)